MTSAIEMRRTAEALPSPAASHLSVCLCRRDSDVGSEVIAMLFPRILDLLYAYGEKVMVRKLPGQPLSVNRPIVSVSGTLTAATIICNHLVAFYNGLS